MQFEWNFVVYGEEKNGTVELEAPLAIEWLSQKGNKIKKFIILKEEKET